MNQLKVSLATFLFGILLLVTACGDKASMNADLALSRIPANATTVTEIDLPSLMKKADFESVKEMPFYKDMLNKMREEDPEAAVLLEDPSRLGIDLDKPAYMFYSINPEDINESFFALITYVKDQKLLEENVKKGDNEILKGSSFSYLEPSGNGIFAWSDEGLCMMGFSPSYVDLVKEAEAYFAEKESNVTQNKNLKKCFSEKHDVASWSNLNAFAENGDAKFALAMANVDPEALKDNYFHSYADFEDGKITGNTTWFLQKGLTKDLDKLFKDKPSDNYAKFIPGEELALFLSNSLDLRGWNEVLSARPQAKSFLNFSLQEYGITFEEIVKALGGDLNLAFFPSESNPSGTGLFITDIDKKDIFDKVLQIAIDQKALTQIEDNLFQFPGGGNIPMYGTSFRLDSGDAYLLIHDKKIFISGDKGLIQDIRDGKVKAGNGEAKKLSKDKLFSLFIDMKNGQEVIGDENTEAFKGVEQFKVTIDRKGIDALVEMDRQDVNSLKYLIEMANEAYLKEKESKGKDLKELEVEDKIEM
jgi:hypothetical protein